MQFLEGVLPKEAMQHVDRIQQAVTSFCEEAQKQYLAFQEQMRLHIEQDQYVLPEHLKPLALKVVDALPETVFAFSLVSNVATEIATLFWGVRALQIFTPIAQTVVQGEIDKVKFEEASGKSWELVKETVEKAKPAIVVSCAVGAVVNAVIGVITMNLEYVVRGSLFALAAAIAHESMGLPAASTNDKPTTPIQPTGTSPSVPFQVEGQGTAM